MITLLEEQGNIRTALITDVSKTMASKTRLGILKVFT